MDKRVQATIQFVRGQDDDLIGFIEQYPKGTLNQVLKAALRLALESGEEIQPPANGHYGMEQRINELEIQVAQLLSRLEHVTLYPFAPMVEDQVEAAPRLSDEERAERAARLKKANW